MEILHMSKFKPGLVEKKSSTSGPPAGIKTTTAYAMSVQCSDHSSTDSQYTIDLPDSKVSCKYSRAVDKKSFRSK